MRRAASLRKLLLGDDGGEVDNDDFFLETSKAKGNRKAQKKGAKEDDGNGNGSEEEEEEEEGDGEMSFTYVPEEFGANVLENKRNANKQVIDVCLESEN